MKTATFIKTIDGWRSDARLYSLSEPLDGHDNVIVSAVVATFSGPETYIFAATRDGECVDFGELDGSFRGGLDHERALKSAGYGVVT